ncbi:MAG: Ig-like domain-containing protein [Duncaniella sp.]|nr:Ig-like domain-containing protein [Duncaniella sp.]
MNKKVFIAAAGALALCAAAVPAGAETLASWTFETGYSVTDLGDNHFLYTPDAEAAVEDITGWSASNIPSILPEEAAGEASAYSLSAFSENRYWQLCNGYQTRVLRVANDTQEIETGIDFSNPDNHKVYYELSFPTKGYKDVAITYAIAPGNNVETPIEMVVSTDGGNTWFDSGSQNSSAVWFQYEDRTVALSANNKDNVLVRLLPTAGKTNWNLRNISITAEKADELASVSNAAVDFFWPMGSTDPQLTATASMPDVFGVYELAIGKGLTISKVGNVTGGSAQTLFKPSNNNASDFSEDDALVLTVIPKKGITFKPTKFAFQASKHGTGGGNIGLEVRQGDKTVMINNSLNPERNNTGNFFTSFEEAIEGFDASSEAVTVVLYINKLATNKEMGFADLTLYGVADGQVLPVPVYSFTLTSTMEGAGALSCAPAGNEFDEGTRLTVSTTENFGYHFTSWTDAEGNVVSTDNPYTFDITGDTQLVANYDKNDVYALNLELKGGANVNLVQYSPEGNVVDGVHYYEAGTEVRLTTYNNRILTFTNWEDNTTAPTRDIVMDGEKNLTADFAACDYIVGWDLYFDQPAGERAADYKDETDNAGLLSLRDPEGNTKTWLTRGISNGAENGKWAARIWKLRSENLYFEISFSTIGYTDITVAAALGIQYNSYTINNMQYSIDGTNFTTVGTYELAPGWTSKEVALPADAANVQRVWVRFMPDRTSPLVGNATDYDGLAIAEIFVLANKEAADDNTAPAVVSVIPADGDTDASANGSIIVNFDEKIKLGTGNATLNGTVLNPRVSGKSVVYPYVGLDYATTYTFNLPAGAITDRSGNPCAAVSTSFTTMERVRPEARVFDAIVAADGSGDYATVQEAVDAAPADRIKPWLIFVKNGNYKEHVNIPANKPMLHFIGQDRDKAVILDDKLCGGANALHVSVGATVVVNSNDCLFENITLENSYGHEKQDGPQALALNTTGDRTIFNNVAMLSYQDTWITPSTSNYRAYVRNSFIEGAVDFIYNSGNIFIDNTTLYITRKSGGYIVAPSHGADVEWGYVFNNCVITAPGVPSETSVWLGRPWHNFPKTVFLNTRAEVTIPATGWYETMGGLPAIWADWNTTDGDGNLVDLSQRRDTYYYTDSDGNRVYGKAKNHLTDEEAAEYTVKNVLSGTDNWQPVIKTEECAAPIAKLENGNISWEPVDYAICYVVTHNDNVVSITTEPSVDVDADKPEGYFVQAVNEFGGLSEKSAVKAAGESGIISTAAEGNFAVEGIYNLNGIRLSAPVKGVNIIRLRDEAGNVKVEKIIIK